jgi:uncharacterized protein
MLLLLIASLILTCDPSVGASVADPARPARQEIAPLADHHVHLLGPYALPLPDPLPPEVEVPDEIRRLLAARAALVGNVRSADDLWHVYARDAQLLEAHLPPNRWLRDPIWFERYLNLGAPGGQRFVPNMIALSGSTGFVSGTVLDLRSGIHTSNFLFGLRKVGDAWRIQADSVTPKAPPRYAAPSTAEQLIEELDRAGIARALVLSEAFWLTGRGARDVRRMKEAADEPAAVRAENDWCAAEVAKFPDRLVFACAVSPLEEYSVAEVARCAKELNARAVKLNFSSAGLDFERHDHLRRARAVFRAANEYKLALVVHLEPGRFYGPAEVEIFLNEIASAAPDVSIQIAHMAGNGPGVTSPEALAAFAELREKNDPRTRNLYFDLGGVVYESISREEAERLAKRMRQIGLDRILFGSDIVAGTQENPPPAQQWLWLKRLLPLTPEDITQVARNSPPYMKKE